MKDKIVDVLKNEHDFQSLKSISDKLHLNVKDSSELRKCLDELINDGIIHESKKHEYLLVCNSKYFRTGILSINRMGNGYVDILGEDDIAVDSAQLHGAIHGDFVEVELFHGNNPKRSGKIVRVLKRDLKKVIGEIVSYKGKIALKLDNEHYDFVVKLTKESTKDCVDGHKVVVEIEKELSQKVFLGKVIKIIGHKNDPKVDILSIAEAHDISAEFSEKTYKELETIPDSVSDSDLVGRKDLTNLLIFTIDGDDTKDIDDAISLQKEGTNYRLGVHIADVSYYVKVGTSLYNDAYNRGTSSYLADTVIPMIPHKLSNGICSLNPNVVRLTITCDMLINDKGKIIEHDIYSSFIKSDKQMTYKNVNKILEENTVPEGYEKYESTLKEMNKLAKILRDEKISRGYIDFGLDEAKIIQDENGVAIDIVKRVQSSAEEMIEDFMIAANETVASHIENMDLPFIYRVHDLPSSEKIEDFSNLLKQMGYKLNTNLNKITPTTMQSILEELKDKSEFKILSDMLLRSMKKAIYSTNNIGHFGLGSRCYTHFTSPIRRFPDLTVHRLLRTYLFEHRIDNETINFNAKYLIDVAEHSSETEANAVDAEREVLSMKMAEYMQAHIGEEYTGIISSVTSFGLFVELDNLVEGLVHISTLDGYYNYIPEQLSLIREDKAKKYRIGDSIKVVVTSASKVLHKIDFEIAKEDKDGNKE